MNWKTRIELVYRAYVRQHRDIDGDVDGLLTKIGDAAIGCEALDPDRRIDLGEAETFNLPIRPEDAPGASEKGFLIVDDSEVMCRQWTFAVHLDPADDAMLFVSAILEKTGNVFTNVYVVKELFTDVGPQ